LVLEIQDMSFECLASGDYRMKGVLYSVAFMSDLGNSFLGRIVLIWETDFCVNMTRVVSEKSGNSDALQDLVHKTIGFIYF
jgi:hypothetical protein